MSEKQPPAAFFRPLYQRKASIQTDYNQELVQVSVDWGKVDQMARDVGGAVNTFIKSLDLDSRIDHGKLAEIFLDHVLRAHATPMIFIPPLNKDA